MNIVQKIAIWGNIFMLMCCETKPDSFLIQNNRVDKIEKGMAFSKIDSLFKQDSVVRNSFGTTINNIDIYRAGKLLFTLRASNDSIPLISNVQIIDERFKTSKGIHLNSTFKNIREQYDIKKIVHSLQTLVVFVKKSSVYFVIDKKELPENLRYKQEAINAIQIPDAAAIKYMMVGWE